MILLDPEALPVIHAHLSLPRPLGAFVAELVPWLGGSEGQALGQALLDVDFRRFRARTSWAHEMERAAATLQRTRLSEQPAGPCSKRQQRRRARQTRSIRAARLRLEEGAVRNACRFGDLRTTLDDLAVCPSTTLATALLPFLFPGGPHLTEGGWVVSWRAQLVKKARHTPLLAQWFAPPRVRRALTPQEQGRWMGRLAVRLADVGRLWDRLDDPWRLPHPFEQALRGWIRACEAEQAGDLLDRFCPAPLYGHRHGAFARAPDPVAVVTDRAPCGRHELAALQLPDTLREWVPMQVQTRTRSPAWWEGFSSTPGLPECLWRAG